MNPAVNALYAEYLEHTGDKAAAASLTLAATLRECAPATPAGVADPLLPRSLTVAQAAKRLGVGADRVYDLCRRGEVAHHRLGKAIRILPEDLAAYEQQVVNASRQPSELHSRYFRL